jgi:hypothetical protein
MRILLKVIHFLVPTAMECCILTQAQKKINGQLSADMGLNGCLEMYAAVINTNYAPLPNQRLSNAKTSPTDCGCRRMQPAKTQASLRQLSSLLALVAQASIVQGCDLPFL